MTQFKGTRGKWQYKVTKKSEIGVQMPNNNFIKLGYIYSDDCGLPTCCRVEEHANAKLISKAPEMLAMLEELISDNTWENTWAIKKEKAKQLIKEATTL